MTQIDQSVYDAAIQKLNDADCVIGMMISPGTFMPVPLESGGIDELRETVTLDHPEQLSGFEKAFIDYQVHGLGDFVYGDMYMILAKDVATLNTHIVNIKTIH